METEKERCMKMMNTYKKAVCMLTGLMLMAAVAGCGAADRNTSYDFYKATNVSYSGGDYGPKDMWIKLYDTDKVELFLIDEPNTGKYELDGHKLNITLDGGETKIKASLDDGEIEFDYGNTEWSFEEADEDDGDDDSAGDGEVLGRLYDLHQRVESLGFNVDGIDTKSLYKDLLDD